ncbi:aminotransferase class V-fold PLP-dependent enzyme [Streptomyces sp. CA-111067]|uniref:aminotransferase class V-fold PLP-dependent enzyme n=1 Tax=Streptomyces sp. CA-111067 TaxID=3240046 RepID=UPI003D96D8B4
MKHEYPFIVIEGGDGAGKTTLARAVAAALKDRGVTYVDRRQVSTTAPYATRLMEHLSQMLWHCGDSPDLPDTFWAHLQAAWFIAHGEHVVSPAAQSGPVIVDGWYYKLTSKLLGQGWSSTEIDQHFSRVPEPDHVIVLRVDPEQSWDRASNRLRPSELGMHGEFAELGKVSFLAYQQAGLDALTIMAGQRGWTILDVPGDERSEDTARRLAAEVEKLLDQSDSGHPQVPAYSWPHVDASLRTAVDRQVRRSLSDRDARGVTGEFETAFTQFVGAPWAVSFSSGTAALHAMCVAAGLGPGDEVIAPAYTFFATASPFAYEGVNLVFADADALGNLDPASLPGLVTPRTKAVIVTHMWGNPCDMTAVAAQCAKLGLMLLEDCSHAHFASWRGQRVGTFGDMAAFSTNQKAVTTGTGGVLVGRTDRHRELALLHGHYNKRCFQEIPGSRPYAPYALTGMGLSSRISTIGAAIGLDQLGKADRIETRRRAVMDAYTHALAGNPVVSPVIVDPDLGRHGLYVMGLRFHPEAATVTVGDFVDRLTAAGTDFDLPGSTTVIADEPLFHRTSRDEGWDTPHTTGPGVFPGAQAFIDNFIKTPLWGYPGDETAVEEHLATLRDVSLQVSR